MAGEIQASEDKDNRPFAGIMFLLLGTTLFPLQDVIIKGLSGHFAVHEIVFLRGLFALPVVLLIVHLDGGFKSLKIGSFGLQLTRALMGFTSYTVYYMALAVMGLAETAAITFSTPLFVIIFATFFLGEKVGLFRWGAVIVGLIGVLIIVKPGSGVFEPAALLAVAAAATYASSIVCTRKLGRRTTGASMTLFTLIVFIISGGVLGLIFSGQDSSSVHPSLEFLYRAWVMPSQEDWMLLMALGLISGVGFFALTQAYRLADTSVVSPFEYSYMPWSVLWGFVFFGMLPGYNTWIGLALIVGAGLFVIYREAVKDGRVFKRRGFGLNSPR